MLKFFLSVVLCVRSEHVVVETPSGNIIGQKNKGYDTFFGVPYATVNPTKPFEKPLLDPNYHGVFFANDSSIMCPQVHEKAGGIIQCLRLNMYVPQTKTEKCAVLVWFPSHFRYGRAADYGGQHLAKEDIIVIVANFRLGVYGFGCLNEPKIPANMGLRDQYAALIWIQKNIAYFGGDPKAVTIGGQGYGGGFVDVHLYSELDILFDKVIIQSGSIFAQGLFGDPNPSAVLQVAKYFGKSIGKGTKPRDVLNFLSKYNPIEVVNATEILNLRWTICKEKHYKYGIKNFITKGPFHLNKKDTIRKTKILIGYNSMELLSVFSKQNSSEFYTSISNIFHQRISHTFKLPKQEKEILSNLLKKFYMGSKEISAATKIELVQSGSDLFLNHAVEMSVDKYVEAGAKVFKYLFSYTGGSKYREGASHGEELKFLFETDTKISGKSQEAVRKHLIGYWANFVKFGNPTPTGKPLLWAPVEADKRPYMEVKEKPVMLDHVFRERMVFLDLLFHVYKKYASVQ